MTGADMPKRLTESSPVPGSTPTKERLPGRVTHPSIEVSVHQVAIRRLPLRRRWLRCPCRWRLITVGDKQAQQHAVDHLHTTTGTEQRALTV